jgi:TFIIF-interacting CTD phosphatase-like protein
MSFYGKKSLKYWDYNNCEAARFNKTPVEIQHQILEKWYPLGMICSKKITTGAIINLKITRYISSLAGWRVELLDNKNYIYQTHPCSLIPEESWYRDMRIKKILKDGSPS